MWKAACAALALLTAPLHAQVVAGRVLDAAGGPAAGAEVRLVALDPQWRPESALAAGLPVESPLASAITDATGAFRIDASAVPAGLRALAFAPKGRPFTLRTRELVAVGALALPSDLELRPSRLVRVTGIVLDENGSKVSIVTIQALSVTADDATAFTTTTDAAGRFALRAPAGSVLTLSCSQGSRFGIVRAPLGEADAVLALHLAPADAVRGTIVDRESGAAIGGARVQVLAPAWDVAAPTEAEDEAAPWGAVPVLANVLSADDGTFAVSVPPGGVAIATSPGIIAAGLLPGRNAPNAGKPLRGVVLDEAGAPVEGAAVRWSEMADVARTDATGRFELLPDVNADVIATTLDGGLATWRSVTVPTSLTLTIPRARLVDGIVRDGDAPLPGATVRIAADGRDVLTATDATGRFAVTLRGARGVNTTRGSIASGLPAARRPRARSVSGASTATVRAVDEQGAPLEGALVRTASTGGDLPDEPPPTSATGPDGLATISFDRDLPETLLVSFPGRASVSIDPKPGATIVARLLPGATIRGVVRDAAGGLVAGAIVDIQHESGHSSNGDDPLARPRRVISSSDGSFVARELPAGSHALRALAPGFRPSPRVRTTLAAGALARVDLTLVAGATLRGTVRDANGPVAGARVTAEPDAGIVAVDNTSRVQLTGEDGAFAFEGLDPAAWYDVAAEADWHADGTGGAHPGDKTVDIVLTATGAIDGETTADADGGTVACADDRGSPPILTQVASARFALEDVVPGTYSCNLVADAAVATIDGIVVHAGEATHVTASVTAVPFAEIAVVDAVTRRPIADASVDVGARSASTDADGHARVALPGPDDRISAEDQDAVEGGVPLSVTAEHHVQSRGVLPIPPPKLTTIALDPTPSVSGRVVDPEGLPAAGAGVGWSSEEGSDVLTDAAGRFVLDRPDVAPDANLVLSAVRVTGATIEGGSLALSDVPEGEEPVIAMTHTPTARLEVIVTDEQGPVPGALVILVGQDARSGLTDADGRFVAEGLDPTTIGVAVGSESGNADYRREVQLPPGETTTVEISLAGAWSIEGRVERDGAPAEGVLVRAETPTGAPMFQARTRSDGSFTVDGLPARVTEMDVAAEGSPVATVHPGDPPLVLQVGTVVVTGRLVSSDGAPLDGYVEIECEPGRPKTALTHAGAFSVQDVPPSMDCTLSALPSDGAAGAFPVHSPASGTLDLGDLELTTRVVHGHASPPGTYFLARTETGLGLGPVATSSDGSFDLKVTGDVKTIIANPNDPGLAWTAARVPASGDVELAFATPATLRLEGASPGAGIVSVLEWEGLAIPSGAVGAFENGVATIEGLPPGHVVLRVELEDSRRRIEADLREGATTVVDVGN